MELDVGVGRRWVCGWVTERRGMGEDRVGGGNVEIIPVSLYMLEE